MSESNPIVIIPTRLGSTRLPNKPLVGIAGIPMIVHVWRRAVAADIGPVIVACAEQEIVHVVEAEGGHAVLTARAGNYLISNQLRKSVTDCETALRIAEMHENEALSAAALGLLDGPHAEVAVSLRETLGQRLG